MLARGLDAALPLCRPGRRWEWLEPVLNQIAELGGDMAAYRRLVAGDKVMLRVGFPLK